MIYKGKLNQPIIILLVVLIALLHAGICYSSDKVSAHFAYYDRNLDGLLSREEYIAALQSEDY